MSNEDSISMWLMNYSDSDSVFFRSFDYGPPEELPDGLKSLGDPEEIQKKTIPF